LILSSTDVSIYICKRHLTEFGFIAILSSKIIRLDKRIHLSLIWNVHDLSRHSLQGLDLGFQGNDIFGLAECRTDTTKTLKHPHVDRIKLIKDTINAFKILQKTTREQPQLVVVEKRYGTFQILL